MIRKAILVGGGQIATHYTPGLIESSTIALTAICDPNPNRLTIAQFPDIPLFTDLSICVSTIKPDLAIVATPTDTHFEICLFLLQKDISVLCEKPLALSEVQVASLLEVANMHGVSCACMLHWRYANEIIAATELARGLGQLIGGNITIHDDYAANAAHVIREDRIGLAGAWVDSGINALSYLDKFSDINNIALVESSQVFDSTGKYPVRAHRCYTLPSKGKFDIYIDWTQPIRNKTSQLEFEEGTLEINHNAQTILLNCKEVFSDPTNNRLTSHYKNLFTSFDSLCEQSRMQSLHTKLFESLKG